MNRTVAQNLAVCGAGLMLVALVGAGLPAVGVVPDDEARRVFGGQSGGSGGSNPDVTKCRKWEEKVDGGCNLEKEKCMKVKSCEPGAEDENGQKLKEGGYCYSDDTGALCGSYVVKLIDCKKKASAPSGGSP